MKKYLLINNYLNYSRDDEEVTSSMCVMGDFDSIEDCITTCENDIIDQAKENAGGMGLEGAEAEEYINHYTNGYTIHHLYDDDFTKEGASRCIYEHWYSNKEYSIENQFMVVRIS